MMIADLIRKTFTAGNAVPSYRCLVMGVFVLGVAFPNNWCAAQTQNQIEIPSVILKLVSDVDIPAREHGVLDSMLVVPSQLVSAGQILAKINDDDQAVNLRKAKLDLEIATAVANSDVQLRIAEEELRVAELDLSRGVSSRERFDGALSASELDQLKLAATRAKLLVDTAKLEMKNAKVKQQLAENEVEQAEAVIARHKIISPLEGVVAEVERDAGEWVQPGDVVLRVIGLSRLRAEGFVAAKLVTRDTLNTKVSFITVASDGKEKVFTGRVSYIGDEVDPVNQQVRIWAEIDNRKMALRSGDWGRLIIGD